MITKPMLADSLEDLKDVKYPVLATPKLDGIRALIVNGKAVTRKFKPVPNEYIRSYLEAYAIEGFDGEIIVRKDEITLPFNQISSAVMSGSGNPDFTYVVFDYCLDPKEPYNQRIARLAKCPKIDKIEYLLPIQINNESELLAFEDLCLNGGYEGIMLRSPNSPYKFGRSTLKEGWLLKLKRFYDGEAIVLAFEEKMHNENVATKDALGNTERSSHQANQIPAGTLGSFIVREVKTGIEFKVGTGFDADFAKLVWSNQKDYIGKILKYKAQKVGEKDKPRFPSFIGFRNEIDMD